VVRFGFQVQTTPDHRLSGLGGGAIGSVQSARKEVASARKVKNRLEILQLKLIFTMIRADLCTERAAGFAVARPADEPEHSLGKVPEAR
jgi:hypothetical protein